MGEGTSVPDLSHLLYPGFYCCFFCLIVNHFINVGCLAEASCPAASRPTPNFVFRPVHGGNEASTPNFNLKRDETVFSLFLKLLSSTNLHENPAFCKEVRRSLQALNRCRHLLHTGFYCRYGASAKHAAKR